MAKPVRVGIIGCGVIAPTHCQSYQLVPGVEVTWACDLIEEKAKKLAGQFGIANTCTDLRDLLAAADVDAVSVCTDHASHAPITEAALDAGKHVICEKALASSPAGVNQMIEAGDRHPELVFAGVFQHRYDPVNRYLKSLVDSNRMGRMLTAGVQMRCLRTNEYYQSGTWRGTWDLEGGAVLINQAIHYIDLLTWIMGGVDAVTGAHANLTHDGVIETEDTAVAILRFKNGALGTLEATCSSHLGWEPTLSFHGATGSLDIRHDKLLKVAFADADEAAKVEAEFEACKENVGVDAAKGYYGKGHTAQIADFIAAIRGERPAFVPGNAARHTVDLVLAIYEAERSGGWVKL